MRDYEKRYNEILEKKENQKTIQDRYEKVKHLFSYESFLQEVHYNIWLSLKSSVGFQDLTTINENTIVNNAITKIIRERMAQNGYQRINKVTDEYEEHFLKNNHPDKKTHPQKIETVFEKRLFTKSIEKSNSDFKPMDIPDNFNIDLKLTENNELTLLLQSMTEKLKKNDIPFFLDMAEGLSNSELQEKYAMSPQSVSNKKKRIQEKLKR